MLLHMMKDESYGVCPACGKGVITQTVASGVNRQIVLVHTRHAQPGHLPEGRCRYDPGPYAGGKADLFPGDTE